MSPRTFSRYFATKDAVVLAFIDDVTDIVAIELAQQPPDMNHLDALYRAHIRAFLGTKTAPASGMTSERLLACARIVNSSPTLRLAAVEFRRDSVNVALAKRMGVAGDDPRLRLVGSIFGTIIMTALGDLSGTTDWDALTVDDIVARLDATYAQFVDVVASVRQPG